MSRFTEARNVVLLVALAALAGLAAVAAVGCTAPAAPPAQSAVPAAQSATPAAPVQPTGATRMERDLLGEKAVPAEAYYYRPGRFLLGGEYFLQSVDAPDSGNPFFHGGEVAVTWMITGETRTYNTRGGYFNAISPARSIYSGGRGAWEAVSHFAYADLDSGTLSGGKYWRWTPMLNWHLSDNARLEFAYGYGSLDRFGLVGKTQFLQTRFQFLL